MSWDLKPVNHIRRTFLQQPAKTNRYLLRLQLSPGQRPPLRPGPHARTRAPRCSARGTPAPARPGALLALADPPVAGDHTRTPGTAPALPGRSRTVECAHPPEASHASACAAVHCHGQQPVNSANWRTTRSRSPISRAVSRRACCWRRHPASISSSSTAPGRNRHRAIRGNQRQRPPPCPSGSFPRVRPSASTGHPAQPIWTPHPAIQRNRRARNPSTTPRVPRPDKSHGRRP